MSSSPQKQNGTSLRSERGSSSTGHGNTLTNVCQRGERGPTFGISLGLKLMWELLCTLLHKLIKIQLRRLFLSSHRPNSCSISVVLELGSISESPGGLGIYPT